MVRSNVRLSAVSRFTYNYEGGFSNNFDLVRLVLASSVVFLHFDHLINEESVSEVLSNFEFISSRAVQGFFVVSGFVVFMSYVRTPDLNRYFVSRFLRLYPAYVVAVLLISVFSVVLPSCSIFHEQEWIKYFIANLSFLNFIKPNLDCLFQGNFDDTINGALWTLKIEVAFYLTVPLIYFAIDKLGSSIVLLSIYLASISYTIILEYFFSVTGSGIYDILSRQLPGQMTYFATGIFLYIYHKKLAPHFLWILPICILVIFLDLNFIQPAALGFLVIFLATAPVKKVSFSKIGDLSYGIYIFHFPIIQTYIHFKVFEGQNVIIFFLTVITTFILSFMSARLVEEPASRLKRRAFN